MQIECCECAREYPMEGNLYEPSAATNHPLLVCPHCGFRHLLSFHPVSNPLPSPSPLSPSSVPPRRPVTKLTLGGYYPWDLDANRFGDKDRVDQSGGNDVDVTDWDTDDEFILGVRWSTTKGPNACAIKLKWRNVTEDGVFADLASTGQINFTTTTTVLVDQAWIYEEDALVPETLGFNYQAGGELQGSNLYPASGTRELLDDFCIEYQWALDCSGASYSHEFAFQPYDVTEGAALTTCVATITMMADPAGGKPAQMMHYARLRRA